MIRSQVESWPPPTLGCTAHASTCRKNLKMQNPPPRIGTDASCRALAAPVWHRRPFF